MFSSLYRLIYSLLFLTISCGDDLAQQETLRARALDLNRCRIAGGSAELRPGEDATTVKLIDPSAPIATRCRLCISTSSGSQKRVPPELWTERQEHSDPCRPWAARCPDDASDP